MKIAVIEIGTNSAKYIIVNTCKNKENSFDILRKESTVNRLSKSMYADKLISDSEIEKSLNIIGKYVEVCKGEEAKLLSIISTSVLRDAANSEEFIEKVKKAHGINIEVVSGEQEANMAYMACSNLINDNQKQFAVIDIGGGSTEVTVGNKNIASEKVSIDIGAVRLTEMFVRNDPISMEEIKNITNYIEGKLRGSSLSSFNGIELIGTGGTVKTIGTMLLKKDYKDEKSINRLEVNLNDIMSIYNLLEKLSIEQRRNIIGLNPKRADVILSGILILTTVMKSYNISNITISSYGVIEGYIKDYLLQSNKLPV